LAQELLRGRAAGRSAARAREGRGEGPFVGGSAAPKPAGFPRAARRAGGGSALAGARPAPAAAAHAGWRQAAAAPRGPRAAAAPGVRGPPLERYGDAGAARRSGGEPAPLPRPATRDLPPRVRARLAPQDVLPAAQIASVAAREHGCPPLRPSRRRRQSP